MRQHLLQVFKIVDKYIHNIEKENEVLDFNAPEDIGKIMDIKIPSKGEGIDKLSSNIENYLKYSLNTGNKQFFNQLYGGFNYPAFIGDMITSLANTSMYTYEVAPVATILELELVKKMNEFTGFKDGDGIFVSGGSNANLVAMFTARNRKDPSIKQNGYSNNNFKAFVSEQAHYSFDTAANLLGIGARNLLKINTDSDGRMLPEDLEYQIKISLEKGDKPFFVSATAGTTVMGAFDPIDKLVEICRKYNLWLHVDGSFGGSVILSRKHRSFFNGIEDSDSFTWNPHKLMNIPLICSVLLINSKQYLQENIINCETDYIFHDTHTSDFDLGTKSIQCGRRVDSLKLWLAWKYFGDEGYESRIGRLFNIVRYFEKMVIDTKELELLAPVQSLSVCFRCIPTDGANPDAFNLELRERLRLNGKTIINFGYLNKTLVLRFVAVNPEVKQKDIKRFFSILMNAYHELTTS